jgi:Phage terminase large subunit
LSTSEEILGKPLRLQPKQSELLWLWDESPYTRIGFGGARGGSKSGGSRRCMLYRMLQYPRSTGLILRRTVKQLEKSHLLKLFEEFPRLRPWYRDQKKQLLFPNGSTLFFGSAQNEKDMGDYYSAEFSDILVDEAQEFSVRELERLSGSSRSTSNRDTMAKMVYAFMPSISEDGTPPIGLPFLKRVFVESATNPDALKPEERNQKWFFLQAFTWDNIEWFRKELDRDGITEDEFYSWSEQNRRDYFLTRTDYGAVLSAITDKNLRDAWLYGKWDVFQGQYFANFDEAKHVVSAEERKKAIKPWHTKWISLDWGFDHPLAAHWHAQDEKGRVITYRELWGRGINEQDLGKKLGELSAGEKLVAFPCSWDAGKLSPRALKEVPKSIIQLITDALPKDFPRPFPADASPGTRVSGARLLRQLLDSGMWQISEECPRLIKCLPSLIRDPKNTEDVLKVDYSTNQIGDDPYDATRMGLQHMLGSTRKPSSEVIAEQARKIEDPVARALFVHKQTFDQRDKSRGVKPANVPGWMNRIR